MAQICFGGVIKLCPYQPEGGTPSQPVNNSGTTNGSNTQASQVVQKPTNTDKATTGAKPTGGVILEISKPANVYYINGNAVIYNISGGNVNIVNNSGNPSSPVNAKTALSPQGEYKKANGPYGFLLNATTAKNGLSVNRFIGENIKALGTIKTENPVQYAIKRVNLHKKFVENLLAAIADRLNFIHIHETKDKTKNLYTYSVKAAGSNIEIGEKLQLKNNNISYSLTLKEGKIKFYEKIGVSGEEEKVNYYLNIATPKYNIREKFSGTESAYSYDLVVKKGNTIQPNKQALNKFVGSTFLPVKPFMGLHYPLFPFSI